jgi:hypothetical protein
MLKKKHRLVVAAVLAGAGFFSPLLCGMTCVETRVERASVAVEAAPAVGEFAGEFVESGVVGCVLTHVVSQLDFGGWTEAVQVGTWIRSGVEMGKLVTVVEAVLLNWVGEV